MRLKGSGYNVGSNWICSLLLVSLRFMSIIFGADVCGGATGRSLAARSPHSVEVKSFREKERDYAEARSRIMGGTEADTTGPAPQVMQPRRGSGGGKPPSGHGGVQ